MKKLLSIALAVMLLTLAAGSALASGGDTIYAVVFRENATTGYMWSYVNSDDSIFGGRRPGQRCGRRPDAGRGQRPHLGYIRCRAGQRNRNLYLCPQLGESDESDPVIVYSFAVGEDLIPQLQSVSGLPEKYMPEYAVVQLTGNATTGYTWTVVHGCRGCACAGQRFLQRPIPPRKAWSARAACIRLYSAQAGREK